MTQQMKDVATMTYREATAELEQVVRALESNQLELEESLELYKRGVELLASLRARLADAEQAMRVVRAHAAEWGIDPNNIGIMGSSAGGHLAATLATHYGSKETRPDFQVLLYPVITMDKSYTHMGSHDQLVGQDASPELEQKYSNEKQVTAETPRAFIVTPAADNIVPVKNTLNYAQALIDHKVPCSVHIYPGGFHGFGSQMSFKDAEIWHQELLRWLQRDGQ